MGDVYTKAHLMSRDYLTVKDFAVSLRWLENRGLAAKEGAKYFLTTEGITLRDRASSSSITETWDNVAEHFRKHQPNI